MMRLLFKVLNKINYYYTRLYYKHVFKQKKRRANPDLDIASYRLIKNGSLLLLANGPSLNESIRKYSHVFLNNTIMCVNEFVHTDYYSQYKPEYYVLADPIYFRSTKEVESKDDRRIVDLVDTLIKKTTWDMCIIIPDSACDSYLFHQLSGCNKIKIKLFRTLEIFDDLSQFFSDEELFHYISNNMVDPTGQTVLNVGICMGLIMGYKDIYIYGADISMFETLELDQKTNELYIVDTHFYGKSREPHIMNMADSFQEYATMFRESMFLDCFSKSLGARVYNASEKSWIDAYERKKI